MRAILLSSIPKIFKSSKRGSFYFSYLKKKKFHKSIIQLAFFSGTSMEHFMTLNTNTIGCFEAKMERGTVFN